VIGRTISHYRILNKLGGGGMGVVYEAVDLSLGRHVALKFLSERSADDSNRVERLRREARAASLLNHPNICTIYEIAESDGQVFIAMELLEGRSLDRILPEGPLALEQFLEYGIQIADALDAAHSKGIVHRDIKPGNILITTKKVAKVLDFGLAQLDPGPANSQAPTAAASVDLTIAGAALGTAAYMSPEQARGEELDARSDLFSFGVLLHEMATGKRLFTGATSAVIFNAILSQRPTPPSRLNPALPPELDRILDKALEKDRDIRCQTATELRIDLKRLRRDTESGLSGAAFPACAPEAPPAPRRTSYAGLIWALVPVLVGLGYFAFTRLRPPPKISTEYVQLTNFSDSATYPALSPDGRMLAFIHSSDVYVKPLPDGDPVQLTHDQSAAAGIWPYTIGLSFSWDGSRIAYDGAKEVWVVPVLGGEPQKFLPNSAALTWVGPQRVMFSEIKTGLHLLIVTSTESRAEHREVYVPPEERGMAHHSRLSPDGKWVLIASEMQGSGAINQCRVVPFEGSAPERTVGPPGRRCLSAAWSPDGKWIYMTANTGSGSHIWRQSFPGGTPEQITSGPTEEESVVAAPDGHSLVAQVVSRESSIWLHDLSGERQISAQESAVEPVFLADGKRLCYVALADKGSDIHAGASGELWMAELDTGRRQRLLPGVSIRYYNVSSDGKKIVYASPDATGISRMWIASLDRRFPPRQVLPDPVSFAFFGADGTLFFQTTEGSRNFVYRVAEDGTGKQRAIEEPIMDLMNVSQDKRWLIASAPIAPVQGEEEKTRAVFAYPVAGGPPTRVCDDLCWLDWSPDGKILYVGVWERLHPWDRAATFAVALKPGVSFPPVPAGGFKSGDQFAATVAGQFPSVEPREFTPSNDPAVYCYRVTTTHGNIYRIPIL
jgi:serine/threonine protein kinase/Tol biopolymer transport system component